MQDCARLVIEVIDTKRWNLDDSTVKTTKLEKPRFQERSVLVAHNQDYDCD